MSRTAITTQRFATRNFDYSILQTALTDQISVTDSYDPNGNPFTVLMWVKVNLLPKPFTPANDANLFSQQDGTGTGRSWLFIDRATNKLATFFGGVGQTYNFVVNNGVWYRIALVKIGNNLTLYVNGVSIGTNVIAPESANGNFIIGNNKVAGDGGRVNLTDVALTDLGHNATQIADDYFSNIFPAFDAHTRFRLQMSAGSGSTINDTTTHARNGTITGGTWSTEVPYKKRSILTAARTAITVARAGV